MTIPYGRQDVDAADRAAVDAVLRSDFLTQGPVVPQFERAVASLSGAAYGMAVNSATSALHAAVAALGLGHGDILWTSPITFVASANCARHCGAEVDFVDIEPETFNMCPDALERRLETASAEGRLPKVIVPVHMGGQAPDMARIGALARSYGVRVVEDASHAIGAEQDGVPVGACTHSDVTVFSFHPVKIVTTGEGGMALTNDGAVADRIRRIAAHGVTRDPARMRDAPHGPWYYEQVGLGWNYRMTDIQAALGLSQLSRLEAFVTRRRQLADIYDARVTKVGAVPPGRRTGARSAWHLYIARLPKADTARHRAVFEAMRADGIGVNVHYIPVHLQPYYRDRGFAPGDFPVAEDYYARAISLPLYPALTDADQGRVVDALSAALERH